MDGSGSALMGVCPHCGRGRVMRTWFVAFETCQVCGARFERAEGSWIGSTLVGYTIVSVLGIGGGIALIVTDTYTAPRLAALLAVAMLLVLLVFPFSKVSWIAVLHGMGHVYPDPPPRVRESPSSPSASSPSAPEADGAKAQPHA